MAARRNGNGRQGKNGGAPDVPRWVRTLFDRHEARLTENERRMDALQEMIEEIRAEGRERAAEHKEEMARMRADSVRRDAGLAESRRQTREIVKIVSRIDADLKAESAARKAESARREAESARREAESARRDAEAARNLEEHRAFMAALEDLRKGR